MVARYENWSALRAGETARMVAACTQCGECFRVCPMLKHAPAAAGADAAATVRGVFDLLQGGAGDEASRAWVSVCTRSGACVPACPEAVDPMLLLRLAKFTAQENGTLPPRDARDAMARVKTFARLTMTEDEWERWQ
jgi:Fe-S oxidoreductase